MARTPEQLEKMQAGKRAAREKREHEAAEARAVKVAEPEESAPEIMPTLGDGTRDEPVEDPLDAPTFHDPADPFERFLADLDPETRELLTDEDGSTPQLRAIFEAEVKKAKEARREVAKKQAAARASRHAKTDAGLIAPEDAAASAVERYMSKKVEWLVEMVRDPNGNLIDEGYRIDGRLYTDGERVKGKTMAHYLSYREQFWRAKQGEMDFEGKGLVNEHRRISTGSLSVTIGRAA